INGIFEVNANVSWQNSGIKTFRNGITGTGTVTQLANSGTFIINGETAQLGGSGSLVLASAGLEISSPDAILAGDKTIEGGEVKISGTLDMDFNTLTLGGDLVVEETGNLVSEDGTLVFNGSASQQLQIREPLTVSGFTLNNAAGITINDNLSVSHVLTLDTGVVQMPGHILTLGNTTQTGSLTSSGGYVDGTYRVWLDATGGLEIRLPLGYGDDYAPVDLLFDGGFVSPGTLTARFDKILPDNYYGNLPVTDGDVVVNNLSSEGYWHIQPGNGLATEMYDITLGIPASMETSIGNADLLRIVKREDINDDWVIPGSFESATVSSITHSGVIGFSEFALGGNSLDNPLPIELLHFTATETEGNVLLTWATGSETNNDYFTLERSLDLKHVEAIGHVAGAGNSARTLHYRFADTSPLEGISYYRLKQTDFDGAFEYSQWAALERGLDGFSLRIVSVLQQNDHVQLWAEAPVGQPLQIEVYDLYGRNLYQTQLVPETHLFQYSFSAEIKGMAIIRVSSTKETAVKKIVVR
ncbi:MAG: T9SS C-terminal target domain-containing protein, partial [Bacteroidetes bacterium]